MGKIKVSTSGIKSSLGNFSYYEAIAEYIWNGFDAKASRIDLNITYGDLNNIDQISVKDNGIGIPQKLLNYKFIPFLESEKHQAVNRNKMQSDIHGRKGIGRLTFFHFATQANWSTVFTDDVSKKNYHYVITVDSQTLDDFSESDLIETEQPVGTCVTCNNIISNISIDDLTRHLAKEFGWFLELNKPKDYCIYINGTPLNYSVIIEDSECKIFNYMNQTEFQVRFIQWNERLNEEYSRYYFIDSEGNEQYKKTTSLNNKGDSFFHSVYIKSVFFNNFSITEKNNQPESLFGHSETDPEFKFIMHEVLNFLKNKRKPFLKVYTDKLITDLEKNNVFPKYNLNNVWDRARRSELENIVRELYQVEPRIFTNLNIEQKKTFVRLLDLIMDSGEKDKLFTIFEDIIELDIQEREQLADLLHISNLSNIIKTINLIKDRYTAISDLNALVFNKEMNANERDHLQKYVENHYWIFGEQYHLVTAAEPKFEQALRRYIYLLTGEKSDSKIDHTDKQKEMDIFMVRQDQRNNIITNVVVELKHPKITLGKKEYNQIDTYFDVILHQDQFNAPNMSWEFFLIGNDYDSYIERLFENAKGHGERSLAFKNDRYKIYVKTWGELITEFELRHKFLNDKLCLERDKIVDNDETAANIILKIQGNTAIQPGQILVQK